MPLYEYICEKCGDKVEAIHSADDDPPEVCTESEICECENDGELNRNYGAEINSGVEKEDEEEKEVGEKTKEFIEKEREEMKRDKERMKDQELDPEEFMS